MTTPQRGSETIQLDGGTLGLLTFEWQNDRYRHRWTFPNTGSTEVADDKPLIQIESVESDSDSHWPASPPLQQIHSQSFGDGREVIFGVGMAGRGHWSASFTLVPDLKCWIVELACKCPGKPEQLQSCYQLQSPQPGQWLTEGECFTVSEEPNVALEAIAPGTSANLKSDQMVFAPRIMTEEIETIQWAFRLRVGK